MTSEEKKAFELALKNDHELQNDVILQKKTFTNKLYVLQNPMSFTFSVWNIIQGKTNNNYANMFLVWNIPEKPTLLT
jgi:hypothetical protein